MLFIAQYEQALDYNIMYYYFHCFYTNVHFLIKIYIVMFSKLHIYYVKANNKRLHQDVLC